MGLFQLKNNQVIVDPDALAIPVFLEIWERDTSKTKERAWRELAYIYYTIDFQSGYQGPSLDERIKNVSRDFMKDEKWTPDKMVKDAMDWYEQNQYDALPSLRLLEGSLIAANKMDKFFRTFDMNERMENMKPVFSSKEISSSLKDIGGIIASIEKLKDTVKKEMSTSTKVRGGGSVGRRER